MEKNKSVLISGITSGLGKAVAMALLEKGFAVSGFAPDAKKCKSLTKEFSTLYNSAAFLITPGNITREKDLAAVIAKTQKKFGHIDILLNNAGVWTEGKLESLTPATIKAVVEVNTYGTMLLTRMVLPLMKRMRRGRIINIISQAGLHAKAERSVYNASKWALTGFTRSLQLELKGSGVAVTGVYPGKINTNLFKAAGVKKDMGNALTVREVAELIVFSASAPGHVVYPELGIKFLD